MTFPMPALDRAEQGRLVRFAIVGASNTAITVSIYALLIGFGTSYTVAAVVGYAAGILNGYTWNRVWTFQSGPFHVPEFSRYLLVQGCGLAANVLGLRFAVETLGMGEITAEIATLIPIVLITFLLNRYWTFRPRARSEFGSVS